MLQAGTVAHPRKNCVGGSSYVHAYVCLYVYIHIHILKDICMHLRIYIYIYIYIDVYIYIRPQIFMYLFTCIVYVWTYTTGAGPPSLGGAPARLGAACVRHPQIGQAPNIIGSQYGHIVGIYGV